MLLSEDNSNKLGPELEMSSWSQSWFIEETHTEKNLGNGANRKELVSFIYELQS